MPTFYTIGFLILALVILAFFLWIGIRNNIQDRALKQSLGESLGLGPLTNAPEELTRQVIAVHQPGQNRRLALRNVSSGSLPRGQLYLFDLWESRSGYRGYAEQCSFAVITPSAHLPRFTLFPRSRIPGKAGGPLSPVIAWAMSPAETEIRLGSPGFEQRYLLAGKDENAVRAVLRPALIDYLIQSPPLLMRANDQTFTVSAFDLYNNQDKPDPATVRALYNQVMRINAFLFG